MVELYSSEGLICLSVLRKGLFTTAAVDNIDHKPSSTQNHRFTVLEFLFSNTRQEMILELNTIVKRLGTKQLQIKCLVFQIYTQM